MELDNIRERVAANMDGDIGIVESDDEHFPDFKFASRVCALSYVSYFFIFYLVCSH